MRGWSRYLGQLTGPTLMAWSLQLPVIPARDVASAVSM
jgi:hypothetical protein